MDIPVESLYVVVIVLCALLFLRVTKSIFKIGLILAAIAALVVFVIPNFS